MSYARAVRCVRFDFCIAQQSSVVASWANRASKKTDSTEAGMLNLLSAGHTIKEINGQKEI